jgi:hypothetical protein
MPPIDARLVCIVTRDVDRNQHGAEFQELCILPGADDIRQHSPRLLIQGMPEPPLSRFGTDKPPPLSQCGGAPWWDADGALA